MKRKGIVLQGILLASCLLCGCTRMNELDTSHKQLVFGATYMTRNNPFFDVLHEAIEDVVEGNGDILISRDPCQDQEKQNSQIQEMIDEGICVLFLNPVDWESVEPALKACKENGVIVINMDTVVKDTQNVISIVETDNYEAGVLCAEDMMKRSSQAKIVVLDNPIQTSITNRVKGFLDTIKDHEEYEVVFTASGKGEFEVSADIMTKVLEEDIDFDVVFGGNDPTALGALATLQQFHREEDILIYGIDGSPDFKAMLALGYVTGTSAQNPKEIGEVAAQTAYDYLEGRQVKEYISIKPYMITRENLSNYEINGWGW